MPIAVQSEVEPIIGAFADRLRAVLDRAMEDWLANPDRSRYRYGRTRANIIFEHIIRHALVEFDGDGAETVKALVEAQSVKFLFRDSVLARFKKGNAKGVGSNIETGAFLNFVEPQGSFAGLPDIHRIEIVYQLNFLGTDYAEVAVVARDRNTRVWAYPLTARPTADIIPLTPRPGPVLTPPVVTPKAAPKEESGDDKSE
jgi:hypothetical protein